MIVIGGKVIQGFGVAKETLRLQMPFFVKHFPEVKGCYPASINVELEYALHIWHPDHTTHPIQWARGRTRAAQKYPQGLAGERFGFLRIRFECPIKSALRQAWVYIPHASP